MKAKRVKSHRKEYLLTKHSLKSNINIYDTKCKPVANMKVSRGVWQLYKYILLFFCGITCTYVIYPTSFPFRLPFLFYYFVIKLFVHRIVSTSYYAVFLSIVKENSRTKNRGLTPVFYPRSDASTFSP